ncbi:hypothetical protein GCWU000341_01725 [Oribacterium sp. oral taxon 078 str. F0262]|nr:hypothetical protein GCWU000341_01725 [Oribacterium sp. oral taxon 078 str. F0262]
MLSCCLLFGILGRRGAGRLPLERAYIEKKRLTMVLCKKDHSEVCSFCAGFRPEKATG